MCFVFTLACICVMVFIRLLFSWAARMLWICFQNLVASNGILVPFIYVKFFVVHFAPKTIIKQIIIFPSSFCNIINISATIDVFIHLSAKKTSARFLNLTLISSRLFFIRDPTRRTNYRRNLYL